MHNNYGSNFQSLHSQIKAFKCSYDKSIIAALEYKYCPYLFLNLVSRI